MSKKTQEEKINELEMKLTFQDDLLQALNEIVTRQDKEIQDLWSANRLLKQSMNDLKQGNSGPAADAPPPHY